MDKIFSKFTIIKLLGIVNLRLLSKRQPGKILFCSLVRLVIFQFLGLVSMIDLP